MVSFNLLFKMNLLNYQKIKHNIALECQLAQEKNTYAQDVKTSKVYRDLPGSCSKGRFQV